MEIKDLIKQAVDRRRNSQQGFNDKKRTIEEWNNYVSSIKEYKGDLWDGIISSNGQKEKWDKIQQLLYGIKDNPKNIGLVKMLEKLGDGDKNGGLFTTALSRMNRPYANIGIVGPYRQGKSTLLRHLIKPISEYVSESDIIPTREGSEPCTGAPINYINELYKGFDEPVAVVEYYSVFEICNRINEYLDKCGLSDWKKIEIFEDDVEKQTSKLKEYCYNHKTDAQQIDEATAGSFRWTFQKMLLEYEEYVKYLDRIPSPIPLSTKEGKNDFKLSATYWDSDDKQRFRVFATKQVDVYVPFKIDGKEVGPIQFLDTPGIGEKRIDVVEGLKKKLQNDIDTVIALEFVPKNGKNEGVDDFHIILAKNYNSGGSSFVYYILNIPQDITPIPLSQAYKNAFKCGIEVPGLELILPKSNKLLMNCREDVVCEYSESEEGGVKQFDVIPHKNSQTVLYDIIYNLATNINNIDKSFTSKAISLYDEVFSEIVKLKDAISSIILPNAIDSYNEKISDIMQDLVYDLKHVKLTEITETVKSNIIEYAEERSVGRETMKVVEVEEEDVEKILKKANEIDDEDEKFRRMAKSVFEVLCKDGPISKSVYDNRAEFTEYQDYRNKLFDSICKDIKDKIEEDPVNEAVKSNKEVIWRVFMKKEYLGFVSSSDSSQDWYEKLMRQFEEDRTAKSLQEKFSSFYSFNININDIITDIVIEGIVSKYLHSDRFDGSEFNTFESANYSFIISLLNIESEIKSILRGRDKEMMEEIRQSVEEKFKAQKNNIITFHPFVKGDHSYTNMESFIRKHYIDILHATGIEDPDKETNSLLENWANLNNQ